MSGEIQFSWEASKDTYALIRNRVGQIWSTSGGTGAFSTYVTANYSDYAIDCTEQGTASAYYVGNWPTAIPAGIYSLVAKNQNGGSPAETDPTVSMGDQNWNGTALMPLSDVATSGQVANFSPIRLARSQMTLNFPFKLVSSADHITPFTSGVVSGQIARDGGAFGALQSGNITEVGLGFYKVNLTSGDLAANTAALSFNAVGISGGNADNRDFTLILQRVSGY